MVDADWLTGRNLSGSVTRSREADEDLTEIWVHIAVDNPPPRTE